MRYTYTYLTIIATCSHQNTSRQSHVKTVKTHHRTKNKMKVGTFEARPSINIYAVISINGKRRTLRGANIRKGKRKYN